MIANEVRDIMKEVIGSAYSGEVLELLRKKDITNRKGEEYSDRFISHVFNGRYHNPDIEQAILDLYDSKLLELKKLQNRLKKIEKKKPAATTTGS